MDSSGIRIHMVRQEIMAHSQIIEDNTKYCDEVNKE